MSFSFCFSVKAEHPYVFPCPITLCPPPFAIHVPQFCAIVTNLVSGDTNFLCPMLLCWQKLPNNTSVLTVSGLWTFSKQGESLGYWLQNAASDFWQRQQRGKRYFSALLWNVRQSPLFRKPFVRVQSSRKVKLFTYLRLVSTLRVRGVTPPLPIHTTMARARTYLPSPFQLVNIRFISWVLGVFVICGAFLWNLCELLHMEAWYTVVLPTDRHLL
jgi:hypothetical protein